MPNHQIIIFVEGQINVLFVAIYFHIFRAGQNRLERQSVPSRRQILPLSQSPLWAEMFDISLLLKRENNILKLYSYGNNQCGIPNMGANDGKA